MTNEWKKRNPEQRACYAANAKAKRHAKALAEGRTPGLVGTPIRTVAEEKKKKRCLKQARLMSDPEKRAKHYAAKNAARRIKWAEKSASEGKIVRKWRYTKEESVVAKKDNQARFRKAHLEYRRKYEAEWKQKLRATPEGRKYLQEQAVVHSAKRRAQKKGCSGSHTIEDIKQLWFLQHGKCAWCAQALGEDKPHVDHWIPLSKGGSNNKDNLRLLHKKCNLSKHAKLPSELKTGVL